LAEIKRKMIALKKENESLKALPRTQKRTDLPRPQR
jgi:hypothetical protein